MSQKCYWPNSKGMKKQIGKYEIQLGYSWDLTHGKGWFARAWLNWDDGFGFSKNKFTAVRKAINNINNPTTQ